jgi:hypothetical protein
MEFAVTRTRDGSPVQHSEAHASFEKFKAAVRAAGGKVPKDRNGRAMLWSERQGWHPRTLGTLSLDEALSRQWVVERLVQRDGRAR